MRCPVTGYPCRHLGCIERPCGSYTDAEKRAYYAEAVLGFLVLIAILGATILIATK
jgi:hypothetical protein